MTRFAAEVKSVRIVPACPKIVTVWMTLSVEMMKNARIVPV